MTRKQSDKKTSCLLAAFSIFAAVTAGGCAVHGDHFENGGRRVTRSHPAQAAIGFGLGVLATGTAALLVNRSGTEQPKEQTSQTQEPEKAQNQY